MSLEVAVQPVILLGMHRSGTAMIARLLDELGLFQGGELQEDHESVWFLDINDLLLKRVNAAWDHPQPIVEFLRNPEAFDLTRRCLEDDLSSSRSRQFLGLKWSQPGRSLLTYDRPWGWKDPRTVFTLPLWLDLFPGAKLVYIIRNGVDVASSLRVRETRELERRRREFDSKPATGSRSRLERAGFKGSARCLTLSGGFSLWEEYVARAEELLATVSNPKHVIRYETFLADPAQPLAELARFCGVESGEAAVREAIGRVGVNASRANAYAADSEVRDFHARVRISRWMTHYGYAE
ncbi:MAG TPA: sulfotransferase [Tepidisphaeraceae bacterium]|jgi:hypothetical protein